MKKKRAGGAGSRPAKVGELIRQELSGMLQDGWVRDPRFAAAFVTVTGVDMSADLAYATCHVSVFSEDRAQVDGVLAALADAKRELRRELGARLTLRHTPDLRFAHDGSAAYGEKMERLLKQVRVETPVQEPIEPGGDTDADESTNPDIVVPEEPDEGGDPTNPG